MLSGTHSTQPGVPLTCDVPESRLGLPAWSLLPWQQIRAVSWVIQHHRVQQREVERSECHWGGSTAPWLLLTHVARLGWAYTTAQEVLWLCPDTSILPREMLMVEMPPERHSEPQL